MSQQATFRRKLCIPVLVLTLAGLPAGSGAAPAPAAGAAERPVAAADDSARPLLPATDAACLQTVARGRQLYSQLQAARRAALDRDAGGLRAALDAVHATLAQLSLPPALQALRAQMVIAANDLADTTRPVDNDLWLPISVEYEKVSFYLPARIRTQTAAAVKAGRAAAARGDRRAAAAQLRTLMSVLDDRRHELPLANLAADVRSARASATLPRPYWKGALEAVQSAMGEIRWLAGVNARPLLAAYNDAVDAYVLWPQRKQAAIDYLDSSRRALGDLKDDAGLAAQAHRLMEKNNLDDRDIRGFVEATGRLIERERDRQRRRLYERFTATAAIHAGARAEAPRLAAPGARQEARPG